MGIPEGGGGGEDPARIKKTKHNIYLFLTAEKDVQVARNGGSGERGNSGNAERKHFFLMEVFPYTYSHHQTFYRSDQKILPYGQGKIDSVTISPNKKRGNRIRGC